MSFPDSPADPFPVMLRVLAVTYPAVNNSAVMVNSFSEASRTRVPPYLLQTRRTFLYVNFQRKPGICRRAEFQARKRGKYPILRIDGRTCRARILPGLHRPCLSACTGWARRDGPGSSLGPANPGPLQMPGKSNRVLLLRRCKSSRTARVLLRISPTLALRRRWDSRTNREHSGGKHQHAPVRQYLFQQQNCGKNVIYFDYGFD